MARQRSTPESVSDVGSVHIDIVAMEASLRHLALLAQHSSGTEPPLLLRIAEVKRLLGRSRARLYEMCATGELECIRDGRSILVPRDAVDAWISRKRQLKGRRPAGSTRRW